MLDLDSLLAPALGLCLDLEAGGGHFHAGGLCRLLLAPDAPLCLGQVGGPLGGFAGQRIALPGQYRHLLGQGVTPAETVTVTAAAPDPVEPVAAVLPSDLLSAGQGLLSAAEATPKKRRTASEGERKHLTTTRIIQDYLGHRNIQHTVRYTVTNPVRFEKALVVAMVNMYYCTYDF